MNKFCIVAKNKGTYFIKRLIEEVGQSSVELFDPWSDFILPEADLYVARTTGIHHSDMDLLILGSLPKQKVLNPEQILKRFRSKPAQYNWFEEHHFPCLPWLPLKGTDLITIEKFFRLYPQMVVKPLVGQGGWGVEALTWETFHPWWKKKKNQKDEDYLIQPLVKDAQEFRYFFINGSEPIVLKRKASSGIVANFQREGEATLTSLPVDFIPMIERLVKESGPQYGAIDLFIKDDFIYILELNTVPGIEQLEKISGQNVVKSFLEMARKSMG